MSVYNAWSVTINGKVALRRHFAKNKRGHDDEVDREVAVKSKKRAKELKAFLEKKAAHKQDTIKVVKVWSEVIVVPDAARKALNPWP